MQPEDVRRGTPADAAAYGPGARDLATDLVGRIGSAEAGHAAAIVLGLPWQQSQAVLEALGPREVARLLAGARADRVPDLLEHIAPKQLTGVLAQLSVPQIAQLVPLLSLALAVRVVQHLSAVTAAELLLSLPTHQRLALQEVLPQPEPYAEAGDYLPLVEQAVRRVVGRLAWTDAQTSSLLTEVFGRRVLVVAMRPPGPTLTVPDLTAVLSATDWRQIGGLVVLTATPLDSGVAGLVREARQRGYLVDAAQWQDERDDGLLKRLLVRLAG